MDTEQAVPVKHHEKQYTMVKSSGNRTPSS